MFLPLPLPFPASFPLIFCVQVVGSHKKDNNGLEQRMPCSGKGG